MVWSDHKAAGAALLNICTYQYKHTSPHRPLKSIKGTYQFVLSFDVCLGFVYLAVYSWEYVLDILE